MANPSRPSGEVYRIAGADNDEGAEQHEGVAEVDRQVLEERKHQRGCIRRTAYIDQRDAGDHTATIISMVSRVRPENPGCWRALLGDFKIVIIEADYAEAEA